MATNIDLTEVIDSSTRFEFDFKYIKFKGLADIPARELFLAIMELDRFGVVSAEDEIIKTMDFDTKEELKELLPQTDNPDKLNAEELLYSNENLRACINRHILRHNLPTIETLDSRLLFSIVDNKAKHINFVLRSFYMEAKKNGSLSFDWNEELARNIDRSKIRAFNGDCEKLQDFNQVAQTLFLYLGKDYKEIYFAFYKSVVGFFSKFK